MSQFKKKGFAVAVGLMLLGYFGAFAVVPSFAQQQQATGLPSYIANSALGVSGAGFARPANTTAYASGQLVANDTVAANAKAVPMGVCRQTGDVGMIKAVRLEKSSTSIANASFRVHVFRFTPTFTNGDGGAYLPANGRAAAEIGYFDVTMDQVYGDGAKGTVATPERVYTCQTSGQAALFGVIEARAAYTPVSGETFNIALEVRR